MSTTTGQTKVIKVPRRGGIGVTAFVRYACGHEDDRYFPYANGKTSMRELAEWCGPLCSACEREKAS